MSLFGNSDDDYDHEAIATPKASFRGSVHASGEAYVNVKRQHGVQNDGRLDVKGSVHETGHSELNVEMMEWDLDDLPEPADTARGFTQIVKDEDYSSQSCDSVSIGKLVIIPENPNVMIAMDAAGFDVLDSFDRRGSVHSRGSLRVDIDDLYFYEQG